METYYWYDYETFGVDPARDRPAQFAGIRTDTELRPVGPPLVLYCKPAPDFLPSPDACLMTGITPQMARKKGVAETDFIAAINAEFSVPETCVVGYNNIRFDDEITRYCLYRNLMDPYAREWRYGNSRWDLIDVMRMTRALRPEGIEWPLDEEGKPSFRLDRLTNANRIDHMGAHDALNDVRATIELAELVKGKQPRLFAYLHAHRGKAKVSQLLAVGKMQPIVHASSRYPAERGCLAIVVALVTHPNNSNGVVVYDLSIDPEPFLRLSVDELHDRLYTPSNRLPVGVERVPLKTVHINKCPALAPLSVVRSDDAKRLLLDLARCHSNLERLKAADGVAEKTAAVVGLDTRKETTQDPDLMLYCGFFSDGDRQTLNGLLSLSAEQLGMATPAFEDSRLKEMLFRYRARNYPESLNISEQNEWRQFRRNRLTNKCLGASLTHSEFEVRMAELEQLPLGGLERQILRDLRDYAEMILA